MKGYIYLIVNQVTKQVYVGKTTNLSRRKAAHFQSLREGTHPNPKLQNSFNAYGEENFSFESQLFEVEDGAELDQKEIDAIQVHNSFMSGFNLTRGGTGGDTKSKLSFEQFCFAYFGNRVHDGMTNRTAKYLGCDSSTISSIRGEKAYDFFREAALLLTEEEQKKYLQEFEEKLEVKTNKPWTVKKTLDNETTLDVMCVVSSYGRGIEATILKKFGLSKGFVFHLMTGGGRQNVKEEYSKMTEEEITKRGKEKFIEWELQSLSRLKLREVYLNLNDKYN